jgi:hypothetical protein
MVQAQPDFSGNTAGMVHFSGQLGLHFPFAKKITKSSTQTVLHQKHPPL